MAVRTVASSSTTVGGTYRRRSTGGSRDLDCAGVVWEGRVALDRVGGVVASKMDVGGRSFGTTTIGSEPGDGFRRWEKVGVSNPRVPRGFFDAGTIAIGWFWWEPKGREAPFQTHQTGGTAGIQADGEY